MNGESQTLVMRRLVRVHKEIIMKLIFISMLFVFLGGCVTSLEELETQERECFNAGGSCQDIYDKIVKRQAFLAQVEYDKLSRCPPNEIEACVHAVDSGCGAKHKSPTDKFSCITKEDMQIILGRW